MDLVGRKKDERSDMDEDGSKESRRERHHLGETNEDEIRMQERAPGRAEDEGPDAPA